MGRRGCGRSTIREHFRFADDAEVAVEIDPRTLVEDRASALAGYGITRASLGVQDFNQTVQEAVNRIQPYDLEPCSEIPSSVRPEHPDHAPQSAVRAFLGVGRWVVVSAATGKPFDVTPDVTQEPTRA